MRYLFSILLFLSFTYSHAITLKTMQNEHRVAYVIGNGDYDESPIDYATIASKRMRDFLETYDFDVVYKENATKRDIIKGLRAFTSLMRKDSVAVFFYAGHSVQVRDKNYLIPIDTSIENDHHVLYEAIELNAILKKMKAAQNRLNIIIINSGHDNPFGERYRTKKKGMADIKTDRHMDLILSTAPDKFSQPYPFTTKLTAILSLKGTSNADAFGLIKTKYKKPYVKLSRESFYFNLPDTLVDRDAKLWKKSIKLATTDALNNYIKKFPKGKHLTEATSKLEQLRLDKIEKEEKQKYLEKLADKNEEAALELEVLKQEEVAKVLANAEAKRLEAEQVKAKEEAAIAAALEEEKRLIRENARFVEPVMVLIQPGKFLMGSHDGNSDEQPVHEVSIDKAFYIGRYEITNIEYKEFLAATKKRVMIPPNWTADMQPAVGVSWDDANAYAAWLSDLTGKKYRLPTEAEWEYVARAGTTTRYFWGDVHQKEGSWLKTFPIQTHDYAWIKTNSNDVTHSVGSKKPNAWGLYDIIGNVWEWCSDTYTDDYTTAPEEEQLKIIRGGSWFSTPNEVTSSHRGANVNDFISYSIGFRLVREK